MKMNMEDLLKKYGYILSSEGEEWNKDIWTIRFCNNNMEIFNTPRLNTPGKYYTCATTEENLKNVLLEVEEFIKDKK